MRLYDREKQRLDELAAAAGYTHTSDYARDKLLGMDATLSRPRSLAIPMSAAERSLVGRKATENGYELVEDYARARLLDRDEEALTISRCVMELRRVTGLVKHLYNRDQIRGREYGELLGLTGEALRAVVAAARRFGRARSSV